MHMRKYFADWESSKRAAEYKKLVLSDTIKISEFGGLRQQGAWAGITQALLSPEEAAAGRFGEDWQQGRRPGLLFAGRGDSL